MLRQTYIFHAANLLLFYVIANKQVLIFHKKQNFYFAFGLKDHDNYEFIVKFAPTISNYKV